MIIKNADIRLLAKRKGLRLWQIAEGLNLNDGNFSRKLRRELSAEEKAKIETIIYELSKGCDEIAKNENNSSRH